MQALLNDLKDNDYRVRKRAVQKLVERGNDDVLPRLMQMMEEENRGARWAASEVLAGIVGPNIQQAIIAALPASSGEFRYLVISTLGDGKFKEAVPALFSILEEEPDKQDHIVGAFAKIGDTSVVPMLIELLQREEDSFSRRRIIWALGKLKDSRAIPALLNELQRYDSITANEAGNALADIGDPAVVPDLLALMEKGEIKCYPCVIYALGCLGDVQAVPALIKRLEHDDAEVSTEAIRALHRLGDSRAVPALIEKLDDNRREPYTRRRVYRSAERALIRFGTFEAQKAINEWRSKTLISRTRHFIEDRLLAIYDFLADDYSYPCVLVLGSVAVIILLATVGLISFGLALLIIALPVGTSLLLLYIIEPVYRQLHRLLRS